MFTTMSEAIEAFEEMLDEIAQPVFGIAPSRIMREIDPIMYRCEFWDYVDAQGVDSDDLEEDAELP